MSSRRSHKKSPAPRRGLLARFGRRRNGRPGESWYLLCEKLESRRMLAVVDLGPLADRTMTTGEATADQGAEYVFRASPGDLVSLRAAGPSALSDFAIAVFDASTPDPAWQRQVLFNDNASADTRDAGVDFVVPADGGTYRVVVTNVAHADSRFTLTAEIQASRFKLPGSDPAFRRPIAAAASGMAHITGDAVLGGTAQIGLYSEAGNLITTSGSSGLMGIPRIDQFIPPGHYAVALIGAVAGEVGMTLCFDGAVDPNKDQPAGKHPNAIVIADVNNDGREDLLTANFYGGVSVLLGNGDATFAAQQTFAEDVQVQDFAIADIDADGRLDVVADSVILVGNGDGTFRRQAGPASGLGWDHLATADLNSDGLPDLVVHDWSSKSTLVLLGNGDYTFQEPHSVEIGSPSSDATIVDVNGDHLLDLVIANESGMTCSILLGKGDGTFADQHVLPLSGPRVSVAAADVNSDGRCDVVAAGSFGVSVLLGRGDGTFAEENCINAGDEPRAVLINDINTDGRVDLITADRSSGTVSIFLGNGDGTFALPQMVCVGGGPACIAIANIDGRSGLDIVTGNADDNSISVVLGNGDGTFVARQRFSVGDRPLSVSATDLNADGRMDVVVANLFGDSISVLLGNGDGTYATRRDVAVGSNPHDLVTLDLNSDGRQDIVVANGYGGYGPSDRTLSVLLGNGDGTFAAESIVTVGSFPADIATGDVNDDGRPDIVTLNIADNTVSVLLGTGDGAFESQRVLHLDAPQALTLGDFDADGRLDIAVSESSDQQMGGVLTVLYGNGDGTFTHHQTVPAVRDPQAISSADINHDGSLDIVIASGNDETIAVLLGNGDGTFAGPQTFVAGSGSEAISIADMNGDGWLDIVTSHGDGNTLSILLGKGDGTVGPPQVFVAGRGPHAISTADMNGDGRLDIVTANTWEGAVSTLLGNGDGTVDAPQTFAVGKSPSAVLIGNIDRKGGLDIVTANVNSVSVLLGKGDGTVDATQTFSEVINPRAVSMADMNGDGELDIVAVNTDGPSVAVLLGNGDGTFAHEKTFFVGAEPADIATADMNGDGWLDIVTANGNGGTVSILLGSGDGTFTAQQTSFVAGQPHALSIGDMNRDGWADVVTISTSYYNSVSVLLGNGDGTFLDEQTYTVGTGLVDVVTADMNDDGWLDVVTANYDDNTVSVLLSNGDGTFANPQTFSVGRSPEAVSTADLNHDGRLDIVTANRFGNSVSVLLGNGDGTFANQLTFSAGKGPCSISTADLNGDGHLDIVTANVVDNSVSILLGNGEGTFFQDSVLLPGIRMTLVGATSASMPASQSVTVAPLNANATPDTLTLARRGSLKVRYDGSATTQGLDMASQVLPEGSLGKGFDARDMAATAAGQRVGVIDQTRRMLFTATPNGSGDLVDPQFVRPIGFVSTAVGDSPVAVATTVAGARDRPADLIDFDGDGLGDVVTANAKNGSVSILRGKGDGTFEPRREIAVGQAPAAVLVADMDGNGRLDIITANSGDNTVSVLLGNDDGTFATQQTFAVGRHPTALAIADIDGKDGLDIVTANADDNTVCILLGNGDGTFSFPLTLAVGSVPTAMTTGDVNGDGWIDIVTVNSGTATISVFAGNGDGTFAAQRTFGVGRRPTAITTGDFNSDGCDDIVTANTDDGTVSVLVSEGASGFFRVQMLRVTGNPTSVTVGDFDGDGRLDIAATSAGACSILLGKGDGTFAGQRSFPVTFGPTAAVAADVNGDSRTDLVTVNTVGDNVSVMLGYGDGTFASQEPNLARLARTVVLPQAGEPFSADALQRKAEQLADLNGDGFADLVVSNINAGSIDIFPSSPDGQFLTGRGGQGSFYGSEWQRLSAGTGPSTVLLADLNGDGAVDIVSANQVSGDVSVRLGVPGMVGTPYFSVAFGFGPEFRYRTSSRVYGYDIDPFSGRGSAIDPQKLSEIAIGDVDGDGVPDLVATSTQDRSFTILHGWMGDDGRWAGFAAPERHTARAPITPAPVVATEPAEVRDVALGDFNRDGRADIAMLDVVRERIIVMSSDRDPSSAALPQAIDLNGVIPKSLQVADITGPSGIPDGILDLVVGNDFGDVLTLCGLGDCRFETYVRADRSVALVAADVDGDGKQDFIYGDKGLDRIVVQDVSREIFAADQRQGVLAPSGVATVDEMVGGRRIKNLVVANGGGNQILVFRNAAGDGGAASAFLPPETFFVGTNPSALAVGDVNKDGIADVVVANEGSDDIMVMLGTKNAVGRWTLHAGPRLATGGRTPVGIAVGDFVTAAGTRGTDGVPDIAVTNQGSKSASILAGLGGGFFNDGSVIPLILPANPIPGPIIPLPRGQIGIGFGDGTFSIVNTRSVGSGGTFFDARTYSTGGSGAVSFATTTQGGTTFLAVGNAGTGSVSQFLARPGAIDFAFDKSATLRDVTGLAYKGSGLFGVSPTQSALELFALDGRQKDGGSSGPQLTALRSAVQFLLVRTSTVALIATIGALRTTTAVSEGAKPAKQAAAADSKSATADGSADAVEKDAGAGKEGEAEGPGSDGKDINEVVAESPLLTSFFAGLSGAEKQLTAVSAEMLEALITADGAKPPKVPAVGGGMPQTAAPAVPAQENAPAATQSTPGDPMGAGALPERTNPAQGDRGRADTPSLRADPSSGAGAGAWSLWAARSRPVTPASVFRWFTARSAAAATRRRVRRPVDRLRRPGLHLPVSNHD